MSSEEAAGSRALRNVSGSVIFSHHGAVFKLDKAEINLNANSTTFQQTACARAYKDAVRTTYRFVDVQDNCSLYYSTITFIVRRSPESLFYT